MALALDGAETTHRFEDVSIVGGEVVEVEHEFKSGTLSVSVSGTDGIVDARISITDTNTGASIAGGRSYTSASNNPRQFILNPGTYEVTLNALGEHSGKTETFSIVVEEGKTTEKITTF